MIEWMILECGMWEIISQCITLITLFIISGIMVIIGTTHYWWFYFSHTYCSLLVMELLQSHCSLLMVALPHSDCSLLMVVLL